MGLALTCDADDGYWFLLDPNTDFVACRDPRMSANAAISSTSGMRRKALRKGELTLVFSAPMGDQFSFQRYERISR